MEGKIKEMKPELGNGFIQLENGKQIFFHYPRVKLNDNHRDLRPGDRVSFEVEKQKTGIVAVKVMKEGDPEC